MTIQLLHDILGGRRGRVVFSHRQGRHFPGPPIFRAPHIPQRDQHGFLYNPETPHDETIHYILVYFSQKRSFVTVLQNGIWGQSNCHLTLLGDF